MTVVEGVKRIPPLPGSAHVLTRKDLDRQNQGDLHRALAEVPGVIVQEEEGYGLRPNISLRGTDPERSRNVTVLEDGVLAAPAPYSAPSVHILPPLGRLDGLEILKGSSQIKYGPRSQGGVINLRSTPIPASFGGRLDVSAGPNGQGRVHAHAGDSRANAGYLVEFFQDATKGFHELPDRSPTGYELRDYLAKVRLNTDRDGSGYQELEFKASRNTQASNSSYLGLTSADFADAPHSRYAASRNDRWESERDLLQLRYGWRPAAWLHVSATAYRQTLARNWYKVSAAAGTPISRALADPGAHSRAYAALRGEGSPDDTLDLEGNKRDFLVHGIQASAVLRGTWSSLRHESEIGVRFHRDSEDRREYVDKWILEAGSLERVSAGKEGSKSNRMAESDAWALHFQERLAWGGFGLIPGVRYENISMRRENWGKDLERAGPGTADDQTVDAWAWGLGATWQPDSGLNLFAGIHQGISPPVPGNSDSAETERSLNYEAGVRSQFLGANLEATGFLSDYRNLLGTELAASGGLSSEKQYNGGRVLVYGFEAGARMDAAGRFDLAFSLPLRLAYTYTRSEFRSSFSSPLEQWLEVEAGDELPYIPRHQVAAGFGIGWRRIALDLMGKYVGEMRTVAGQGGIPAERAAGDYSYLDFSARFALTENTSLYGSIRNLRDEVGVAARHPAGLRPTMPRTVVAGFRSGF
jgi:Fe(3+) dicitrate transport protein